MTELIYNNKNNSWTDRYILYSTLDTLYSGLFLASEEIPQFISLYGADIDEFASFCWGTRKTPVFYIVRIKPERLRTTSIDNTNIVCLLRSSELVSLKQVTQWRQWTYFKIICSISCVGRVMIMKNGHSHMFGNQVLPVYFFPMAQRENEM